MWPFKIFIEICLIYNAMLISSEQQSDSVTYICTYIHIYSYILTRIYTHTRGSNLLCWGVMWIHIRRRWMCICIHASFFIFFSSMVYHKIMNIFSLPTVGPCGLSVLYIRVCICQPKPPLHLSPSPFHLGNHKSVLYVCFTKVHLRHILDATY